MVSEQNFQPQGRDTTNGPHLHTYIPRSDGTILVGGVSYIPQLPTPAVATTVPVGMPAITPVLIQKHGQIQSLIPQTLSDAQLAAPAYNAAQYHHYPSASHPF